MGNFYTDFIQQHPLYLSRERVCQWTMLEPKTRAAVAGIVQDAEEMGIELAWWETYRSIDRQGLLFMQHVSSLRNVSVHHYGLACDLVRMVNGEPSWKGDFSFLGPLAKAHGLIWGGDWHNFKDSYHVQRCTISDQARLFIGTWYPDDDYDPTKETD